MPVIVRTASARALRVLLGLAVVLSLAACSKCDVPTWRHDAPAPQSCHDDPPLQ